MKKLNNLLSELNKIPNINNGGCGFAALEIYDFLKSEEKDPVITFLYKDSIAPFCPSAIIEYNLNQSYIRKESKNIYTPSHVCVLFEGNYYDSTGKVDISEYKHKHYFMRSDLELCLKNDTWNSEFKN